MCLNVLECDLDRRNERVLANQGLVYKVAHGFLGRGLPREDLVSEGQFGLIRAAELFDPGRGIRFSTYATYWIRQAIHRGVTDKAHLIRVPCWATRAGMTWNRLRAEDGHDDVGFHPAPQRGKADCIRAAARMLRAEVHQFERARFEDEHAGGVVEPMEEDPHEADEARRVVFAQVERALSVLGDRERLVLVLRHGLDGESPRTLAEAAQVVGVTKERVRQIQLAAERRIRDAFPNLLEDD